MSDDAKSPAGFTRREFLHAAGAGAGALALGVAAAPASAGDTAPVAALARRRPAPTTSFSSSPTRSAISGRASCRPASVAGARAPAAARHHLHQPPHQLVRLHAVALGHLHRPAHPADGHVRQHELPLDHQHVDRDPDARRHAARRRATTRPTRASGTSPRSSRPSTSSARPTKIFTEEMEAYGFSDYFGIGDIIAHTQGGYLHDGVIAAMGGKLAARQGRASSRREGKPWFLAVNLVNPHDVMFYDTDAPGTVVQAERGITHVARDPADPLYASAVGFRPAGEPRVSRSTRRAARPRTRDFLQLARRAGRRASRTRSRAGAGGTTTTSTACATSTATSRAVLDELDASGLADRTIVVIDRGPRRHGWRAPAARERRRRLSRAEQRAARRSRTPPVPGRQAVPRAHVRTSTSRRRSWPSPASRRRASAPRSQATCRARTCLRCSPRPRARAQRAARGGAVQLQHVRLPRRRLPRTRPSTSCSRAATRRSSRRRASCLT